MKRILLLLLLLVSSIAPSLAAAPERLEIALRLYVGLFSTDTQPIDGATLMLDLDREGDRWRRVWGMARDFNVSTHLGRVVRSTVLDEKVDLTIEMLIEGDSWIPGGRAKYDITLKRDLQGNLKGTYLGVFAGKQLKGVVEGEVKPQRGELMPPGNVPVKAGEHPRILFRKGQLPDLRARANTPFGQACLAKMGGPVGLGMRYQLFGDAKVAAEAFEQVTGLVNQGWHSDQFGNNVGARMEQAALTYDLCYDAWTPGQRNKVENYLMYGAYGIMYEQRALGAGINWHVCSNWSAPLFAGLGFAGLALWGEKGAEPGKPISPSEAESIAPAAEYEPGKGVPVIPLEIGKAPSKWLALPFIDYVVDSDPLQGIGGLERARAEIGTKVDIDDAEYEFQPLDPKFVLPGGGIDLSKFQTKASATMVFYTVLHNDRTRSVKISMPATRSGRPVVVLNGNVLHDGRVVEIQEGNYPLVVAGRWMIKWKALMPKFEEATVDDMERNRDILAVRQAEYRDGYRD